MAQRGLAAAATIHINSSREGEALPLSSFLPSSRVLGVQALGVLVGGSLGCEKNRLPGKNPVTALQLPSMACCC